MPLYAFACECGNEFEELIHLSEYRKMNGKYKCPECGVEAYRTYGSNSANLHSVTRVSMTLGMHPDQIADGTAARVHPGAEFDGQGNMVTHGLKERRQRIKEHNKATGQNLTETF